MTQTTKQAKPKQTVMSSVLDAVSKFDASWNFAKNNHHARWTRNWKLYNNKRVAPGYQGISNTFVPMPFSIVETLTANLCAGRPSIDFVPQDMYKYIETYYKLGVKPDLKALNAQFDYYWDCDNWDQKTIFLVRGAFLYGTSCEWVYWDEDKPRVEPLAVRDAIIDPSLKDPMQLWTNPKAYFTGRRYMTTKENLESQTMVDPAKPGEIKRRFKNLHMVMPGVIADGEDDKSNKEGFIGAVDDSSKLVEVIEITNGETIWSVANRAVMIEERPNTLGIHFLVINRFVADESMIHGKAIIDPIAAPVETLNDVTNQTVDAVTDVLSPQRELDPAYQDQIELVTNGPDIVYPFKPGSLQYINKPVVSAESFRERQNIKNEIREATGADQVVQGVQNQDGATATEINAQLNQANQRFELYISMLEREGLYQRTKIVYHMMLHYLDGKQLVPQQTSDGPKFRAFDPAQFDKTYEPQIKLAARVNSQKQRTARQATESYSILIKDPSNDQWQVKKIMYPKMFDLSEDEVDKIIGAQPPEQMGMQPGMPGLPAGADMPPMAPDAGAMA